MIPKNKASTVQEYAQESGYKQSPTQDQIKAGVVPLDTLPAQWWNFLWNQMTTQHNLSVQTSNTIITELNNILVAAGIEPSEASSDQLAAAIKALIHSNIGHFEDLQFNSANADTVVGALNDLYDILNTSISSIESKIPSTASAENQLADKDFVNSSIGTNTANFIGTFDSQEELEAYSGTLTNNDYAFVTTTDAAGNVLYQRYKYNADEQKWIFEYQLNNTGFTATQMAALNSGITEEKVSQISLMRGATSSSDGTEGFVPRPLKGQQDMFLKGDGTWSKVGAGGASSGTGTRFQGIFENWTSVPTDGDMYPKGTPQEGDEIFVQNMLDYGGLVALDLKAEEMGMEKPEDASEAPWWPEGNYEAAILLPLIYFEEARLSSQNASYATLDVSDSTALETPLTVTPISSTPSTPTIIQGVPNEEANAYKYLLIFVESMTSIVKAYFIGFDGGIPEDEANSTYKLRYEGDWEVDAKIGWMPEYSMMQLIPVMQGVYQEDGVWKDGKAGTVPAPFSGQVDAFLSAKGTWSNIPVMQGASQNSAGKTGTVPTPSAGQQGNFLKGNGIWSPLPVMQGVSQNSDGTWVDGASGMTPVPTKYSRANEFLCANGTWSSVFLNIIAVQLTVTKGSLKWSTVSYAGGRIPSQGRCIWYDPATNKYYYSFGSTQYERKSTTRWDIKDWGSVYPTNGQLVWHDASGNTYYSNGTTQLQLVNGSWVTKDWGEIYPRFGNYTWQDNEGHVYYDNITNQSNGEHYELINGTWIQSNKNTNPIAIEGIDVWKDSFGNIYCSMRREGSSSSYYRHMKLVNGEWRYINLHYSIEGRYVWHHKASGTTYYSDGSVNLRFSYDGSWVPSPIPFPTSDMSLNGMDISLLTKNGYIYAIYYHHGDSEQFSISDLSTASVSVSNLQGIINTSNKVTTSICVNNASYRNVQGSFSLSFYDDGGWVKVSCTVKINDTYTAGCTLIAPITNEQSTAHALICVPKLAQ